MPSQVTAVRWNEEYRYWEEFPTYTVDGSSRKVHIDTDELSWWSTLISNKEVDSGRAEIESLEIQNEIPYSVLEVIEIRADISIVGEEGNMYINCRFIDNARSIDKVQKTDMFSVSGKNLEQVDIHYVPLFEGTYEVECELKKKARVFRDKILSVKRIQMDITIPPVRSDRNPPLATIQECGIHRNQNGLFTPYIKFSAGGEGHRSRSFWGNWYLWKDGKSIDKHGIHGEKPTLAIPLDGETIYAREVMSRKIQRKRKYLDLHSGKYVLDCVLWGSNSAIGTFPNYQSGNKVRELITKMIKNFISQDPLGAGEVLWALVPAARGDRVEGVNTEFIIVAGETIEEFNTPTPTPEPEPAASCGSPLNPLNGRTQKVVDAIVAALPGVTRCQDVEFDTFSQRDASSIGTLFLNGKNLMSLRYNDFHGLDTLELLYLQNNNLASLPSNLFDDLQILGWLDLSGNRLTSLDKDIFDRIYSFRLFDLNLSGNRLTSLDKDIFDGLSAMYILDLSDNRLSSLPADLFDGLSDLNYLYLQGNNLDNLPPSYFSGQSLNSLHTLYLGNTNATPEQFAAYKAVLPALTNLKLKSP